MAASTVQTISVIVPKNPFVPKGLSSVKHCLAALDIEKLMEWWPGKPHVPHRNPTKVRDIQRSLDWKRVAQIAAYLLQKEIEDAPDKIDEFFGKIYAGKANEPGRIWPPKVPSIVGFQPSDYPTFSNVLLHVNGAVVRKIGSSQTAKLVFKEDDAKLNFTVIDGQHRINGAYLAIQIKKSEAPTAKWQVPAEIFVDLDAQGAAPRHQAQIFIDVNSNQKKVDKSLVADLFPTARGNREALTNIERAQDIGRKLMLEVGPLVGMIQIPGIRFGQKDVIALATLNSAIEEELEVLHSAGLESLESQSEFISLCLDAWLEATGRKLSSDPEAQLASDNVAYQGRFISSFLKLIPACILKLKGRSNLSADKKNKDILEVWLRDTLQRAGLIKGGRFLNKKDMQARRYLGTGGIALFRDTLWAAALGNDELPTDPQKLADRAAKNQAKVNVQLGTDV